MGFITAVYNTKLKKLPVDSSAPENKTSPISKGRTLGVDSILDFESGHFKVQLSNDAGIWYIFPPHWKSSFSLAEKTELAIVQRGYPLDRGALTVVGVQGLNLDGSLNDNKPDEFNDLIGLFTYVSGCPKFIYLLKGTTDPGVFYTKAPLNPLGCARVDLGFQRGLWELGLHRGYQALVQADKVRLMRDADKDYQRDDKVSLETGNGVNLHSAFNAASVGKNSAGCFNIWDHRLYQEFINYCKNSKQSKFDLAMLLGGWVVDLNGGQIDPLNDTINPKLDLIPSEWKSESSPLVIVLVHAFAAQGITNPTVLAYAASTICCESSWDPNAVNTTDVASKTKCPGTGLAQITWCDNWRAVEKATGIKFVDYPEHMKNPVMSLRAKAAFYQINGMIPYIERGQYESAAGIYNAGDVHYRSDYTRKVAKGVSDWLPVFLP